MAVDIFGNTYISGRTYGNLEGTNAGVCDAYLVKYDGLGNFLWKRQIGTSKEDGSFSVAVDTVGNAYISGYTGGNLGGTLAGGWDACLIKYNGAGNVLWKRQVGTSSDDNSRSVAVDAFGNAYITGNTYGNLGGTNAGMSDAFLTKYDQSGNLLWNRQIGTSSYDFSDSVAVDTSGSIYISGWTGGSISGSNAGSWDAFLVKYDDTGNVLWKRQIGTSSEDYSYSTAVDDFGNAYMCGFTKGTLGGSNVGSWDAFLVKYDESGNLLWKRQIGTSSDDHCYSVAVDVFGNPFISGYTGGNLGGANTGGLDAFLVKYDGAGNVLWAQQMGTSSDDNSWSATVDSLGNAYISGYTYGNLEGTYAGSGDAFLVKYEIPEPATLSLLALGGLAMLKRRRQ